MGKRVLTSASPKPSTPKPSPHLWLAPRPALTPGRNRFLQGAAVQAFVRSFGGRSSSGLKATGKPQPPPGTQGRRSCFPTPPPAPGLECRFVGVPSSVAQGCSAAWAREPSRCGLQALPRPAPRGPLTQADDCERRPGARRPLRPRGRALLHAGASRARAPAARRPGLRLGLGLARRLRPGCGRRLRRRLCAAAVQARNARGHIGRGVTGPAGAQRRSPGRTLGRRCPQAPAGSPSPDCAPTPPARPCPGAPCPSGPRVAPRCAARTVPPRVRRWVPVCPPVRPLA